jgi:hypothetical protein
MTVTGLLDFDFSHIASPLDEFFYSFVDFHGLLCSPQESSAKYQLLRSYQLNGFPSELPPSDPPRKGKMRFGDEPVFNWNTARTWDTSLEAQDVKTPRNLEAKMPDQGLSGLYWFCQEICQPYFLMEGWLRSRTPEQLEKSKKDGENAIEKYLNGFGY